MSLCRSERLDAKMLEESVDTDYNGEELTIYKVSAKGMAWLLENRSQLKLKREENTPHTESDDLPF